MSDNALDKLLSLSVSGEVSTKSSATRRRFHRRLRANLRQALDREGLDGRIIDRRDRIDIEEAGQGAAATVSRVFGIQSVRVAQRVAGHRMADLIETGVRLFGRHVAERRFAVRARRVGQRRQVPLGTTELARELGQALVDCGGRVDLDDPEVCVHAEIRSDGLLLFDDPLQGPGGLPIGTEGRGLALISGGFDSAVAAWRMLLRGMDLDFVLFSLAGQAHERAVRQVLDILNRRWMAGSHSRLHVVDFRPVVAEMRQHVHGSYWQVLLKRLMMQSAERIARSIRADALVTGEVIGQVSSQTLSNLRSITAHTAIPVLRPLVGLNKQEIVEQARDIGTGEISAETVEFCALDGGRPVTRCNVGRLDGQQRRIDSTLVERLTEARHIVDRADFGEVEPDRVEIDAPPPGAAVIDLRSEAEHRQWAWPDSIHLEFDRAMDVAASLPADRTYVFFCQYGLKSAFLAERLRAAGMDSYSIRGGTRTLQAIERGRTAARTGTG